MTSEATRRSATKQFGEEMIASFTALETERAKLPAARSAATLVDDVACLRWGVGSVVADVGAWGGYWSQKLVERYGCTCVAIDLSIRGLSETAEREVLAVAADADMLPLSAGSLDGVWCRDTLSMLEDPTAALAEFARVLRPSGTLMLYLAVPTELLEPNERERLMFALESHAWWSRGRPPVDEAIAAAGFRVIDCATRSPDYSEALLVNDPSEVTDELLRVAQLRRGAEPLREALGPGWYEQFLAWSHWQAYLLLGKLETVAWFLRKPSA